MENTTHILGEGTEYEAKLTCCFSDGDWYGTLVFKDTTFSPITEIDKELELSIQFVYCTPYAPNGVLCYHRGEQYWKQLKLIFQHVRMSAIRAQQS
jgi:hypothetical protein